MAQLERETRASCPFLSGRNSSHSPHTSSRVPPLMSSSSQSTNSWQEIRIFVSSTFKDYHCEREILVHNVFPRLRDWCEKRNLLLAEVDLRWGVPAQSSIGTTLRACLGEIDRCSEVNTSPFFINMLGHRYGWIPAPHDVPDDVRAAYQWIDNASVTHMEIVHAAFRNYNPNALFLIRDPDFLKDLSSEILPDFIETNSQSKDSLDLLKSLLREAYAPTNQVYDYVPQYHGIETQSTALPKVRLAQMNYFCDTILEFFQNAINKQYPRQPQSQQSQLSTNLHDEFFEPKDLKISLFSQQEHFIVQKSQRPLLGRDVELGFLLQYATSAALPEVGPEPLPVNPLISSTEHSPLPFWIYGKMNLDLPILLYSPQPSSGKSSLLSSLFLQCQQLLPPSSIFFHSFQAHSNDDLFLPNSLTLFLFRFCLEFGNETIHDKLSTSLSRHPSLANIPQDYLMTLARQIIQQTDDESFFSSLADPSSSPLVPSPIIIILDEIDFPSDFPHGLDVILRLFSSSSSSPFPFIAKASHFRIIFSSSHPHIFNSYFKHFVPHIFYLTNIIYLTLLPSSTLQLIVNNYFSRYNKQLDHSQLTLLLSHPSSSNLTWLSIACDTLRLFGAFETVNSYIQSLPLTADELLLKYLTRIESLSHHLTSLEPSQGEEYDDSCDSDVDGEDRTTRRMRRMRRRSYNVFSLYFQSTLHLLLASRSGLQELEIRILLNQIQLETEEILISRSRQNMETKDNEFTSTVQWNEVYLSSPYMKYCASPQQVEPIPYMNWSIVYSFLKIFLKISSPFDLTSKYLNHPYKPRYVFKSSHLQQLLQRYFHLSTPSSRTAPPRASPSQQLDPKLKYYSLKLVQYFRFPSPPPSATATAPAVTAPVIEIDLFRRREEYPYQLLSCQLYQLFQEYLFSNDWQYLSYPQQRYLMNSMRCIHTIPIPFTSHTPSHAPGRSCVSSPVPSKEFMCLGCSMKNTKNKVFLNRQCCYICGNGIHSIYFVTGSQCSVQLNHMESYCYQCQLHHPQYYQRSSSFKNPPPPQARHTQPPNAMKSSHTPHSNSHSLPNHSGVPLECVYCHFPISNFSPALPVIQCHFCTLLGKTRCVYIEKKNQEHET